MAEYIERTEELILSMRAGARAISNTKKYHGTIYMADVFSENPKEIPYLQASEILYAASEEKSADVAPVWHGRWLFVTKGQMTSAWCCSECGRTVVITCDEELRQSKLEKEYPFCHCGAKMDLEVPENETL